jgi:biopolymer transport protein ExbB
MKHLIAAATLAVAVLLAQPTPVAAQEGAPAGGAPHGATESKTSGKKIGQLIKEGGIVMWPLGIASVLMVALTAEGFFRLRVQKLAPPPLVAKVREQMSMGSYQEAWETCQANPCYFSAVLSSGLERIGRGKESVEHIMQDVALKESTLLKTRNTYLSVIGVVTPMIGLIGTVSGMIGAFAVLGASGVTDPRMLSEKISEVLVATFTGLAVAVPAFIFYYVLRNRSQGVVIQVDSIMNRLMEDIPYPDLSGIKIGENFSAGTTVYGGETAQHA